MNWRDAAESSRVSDAGCVDIAQQRRAEYIGTLLVGPINWPACSRLLLIVATTALVSTTLIIVYAVSQ
jgi:hypothetical protein